MIIVYHFKWLLSYSKINYIFKANYIYSQVNRIIFKIDEHKQFLELLYIYIFYYAVK